MIIWPSKENCKFNTNEKWRLNKYVKVKFEIWHPSHHDDKTSNISTISFHNKTQSTKNLPPSVHDKLSSLLDRHFIQ